MKRNSHRFAGLMPVVVLAAALHGAPVVAQTMDQAQAWPPASSVPALQARMKSIREATDPQRRMALMEEQIKALEAASQGVPVGCPMMGGQMMGGMMMDPKFMQEHMQLMQQHMNMMERMLKMNPGMPPAAPN
ncbi:hypothetical protein CKCBHOJB_02643 [Thauera sp. GDN1]|uniref:hypothetical protein n=1 Tax=Thauera sp. GDN1 TaxID=2944810 RepID=UPI0024798658|nr:hypothetical protein [Thauera sp. GDN1]WEN43042.1 hypothetical protein CKCBHOJB_02643 [Thauera sp. GDN1]